MISDAVQEDQGAKGNKTYELPPGVGTQLFAEMAATLGLHVVMLLPTRITVEGPNEDDQAVFRRPASQPDAAVPVRFLSRSTWSSTATPASNTPSSSRYAAC
jgi:hypothetical protein